MNTNQEIVSMSQLKILTIVRKKYQDFFKCLQLEWEKYFNIEHIFDGPENLKDYLHKQIGILFLDVLFYKKFHLEYYGIFQKKFKNFLYVVVSDERRDSDEEVYKALTDQILYIEGKESLVRWNSSAILRRFWNIYSKPTVVIYKDFIIDFISRELFMNQQKIELTTKEFSFLKILVENRTNYVPKIEIIKQVWGHDDDETRVLDQVLHKLKTKIGDRYFSVKRDKGIRFM